MDRNTGTIVLCLALGAAVMYGTTHYRINVEPVAPPGAPAPQVAHAPPGADPRLLPAEVAQPRAAEPPMRDAKVRPAAADMTVSKPPAVRIVSVADGAVKWLPSTAPSSGIPAVNSSVTVTFDRLLSPGSGGKGKEELYLVTGNKIDKQLVAPLDPMNKLGAVRTDTADATTVALNLALLADKFNVARFEFWVGVTDDPMKPTEFSPAASVLTVLAPTASAADRSVVVAEQTNSPFLVAARIGGRIDVYGKTQFEPYLRLSGSVVGVTTGFRFILQPTKPAGTAFEVESEPDARNANGAWSARPKLPVLADGTEADLYVLAESTNVRVYATPVQLKFNYIPEALDAPTLTLPPTALESKNLNAKAAPSPFSAPGLPAYYTNGTKFSVVVSKSPANAQALIYYVDSDTPKFPGAAAADNTPLTNIEVGPGRDHVIRVAAARGRFVGPTAQVKLLVETAAPTVEDVTPQPGFGSSNGVPVEKIVVRFNGRNPIDAATVEAARFKVTHIENTSRDGGNRVKGAVFDAGMNTVTLNVDKILPGTYQVAILKGVKDVFGNDMAALPSVVDTANNLAEYTIATQGAGPGAALPSRTVGITNQTGPPVDFPEYVKFRVSPDGFNPSDRVETRVMRLYYYRDAHRVAQLINRTVKSYNAATVDVRRRAADGVRDNADKAEDDRKTLEARAVRAAQDARAAEAEVANLQSGIATARNQSAGARVELLQRQQELEQARRDLARAELLTPGRTDNDVALEEQRQLLDALGRDRASVSRAITGAVEPEKTRLTNQLAEIDDRVKVEKRRLDRLLAENSTRADSGADAARARVKALEVEISKLQSVSTTGDLVERANTDKLAAAQANLAGKRELEAKAVEAWQVKELQERRLRENQFRTETAALREDPDTYAPGNPNSVDAVMQVSVSVIGEGLIQLRGPIKGLNVIRTMVNQIDAPVGQVRVAVHTLQVNGERADRMEKVVANIQRYLDHSRFLTAQSAVMLRNAVTSVAARRAAEAAATLAPGCTQWDRDQKYLYSFFGKDFIDELIQLDSEFLRTGNKLLSLNSMDSTSLSAALFLMALAKNDVRIEIINEFQATVMRELPQAEWKYYMAGISQPKHCDACKDRKEYLLANNSQFQSFIGFFNSQVTGNDTLNPLQREFVKLAQIFKARMVTEMQLRQRVMERALLEERFITKYAEEREKANKLEEEAKDELARFRKLVPQAIIQSTAVATDITRQVGSIDAVLAPTRALIEELSNEEADDSKLDRANPVFANGAWYRFELAEADRTLRPVWVVRPNPDDPNRFTWYADFSDAKGLNARLEGTLKLLEEFVYSGAEREAFVRVQTVIRRLTTGSGERRILFWGSATTKEKEPIEGKTDYIRFLDDLELLDNLIHTESDKFRATLGRLLTALRRDPAAVAEALLEFQSAKAFAASRLNPNGAFAKTLAGLFAAAQPPFEAMMNYQAALKRAQDARRPLDEKKLLDLLVDEMEDKYVEILEGTRAHTSNVDNYLKSIATALDDDFNTQYYLPSFRRAREASRYWDVTLAQIETTSVLTNNRALGKVSPAATFEFDLPKRDILITEGFKSAKALFDEYGALMNDPSFLALAKIYSGNPVSMMQGGGGGLSSVRNVLPGLPTSTDEKIMAQAGPGRREFGAALDGLIPDPAIYKFETGTGYEIRPVLSPDGQAVVFGFDYMYTTDVREPVRADEKHLGRVRRHFISTDVQLGNYELREVSKYLVSIKVARTGKGVQLLQDIPGVGVLFRPLPSAGASLQQNLIYSQATIFPTLFDLMGLRYAPAVADLDPLADRMSEFAARFRRLDVEQRVYDRGSIGVDDALRTPLGERRYDLYRPPVSLPFVHPNGTIGLGLRRFDGTLREGYDVNEAYPDSRFSPYASPEGRPKPFNNGQPGAPGYDLPPGYGPEYGAHPGGPHPLHDPRPFMEMPKMPNANPLGAPRAYPPPMTYPTHPGANPLEQPRPLNGGAMRVPGYGSVGVGQPVPFNPAFSTTPPGQRPSSELPTTGQQTSVTPGGSPVPRPSAPTPLPVRPAQPAVPPLPTVPPGVGGSR